MKRFVSLLLMFASASLLPLNTSAQQKVMGTPWKYVLPFESVTLSKSKSSEIKYSQLWVVYSDRDNNPTYTTEEGNVQMNLINFMDYFMVTEETDNRLHIIQAPEDAIDAYNLTVSRYTDYGWVDKNRMLLWVNCLVTDFNKVAKKAMVQNSIEWAKEIQEGDNSEIVKFYKNPQLTGPTGKESKLTEILFVYKISENRNSVLLGKSTKYKDPRDVKNTIVGWATRKRMIFWDHRLALEPNWLENAAEERKALGIKAAFFRDKTEALKNKNNSGGDMANAVWDDDPYDKRFLGEYPRFPYLLNDTITGIAHAAVFGKPFIVSGNQTTEGSLLTEAWVRKKITEMEGRKRNINIVFVIDGTYSMLPYFRSVAVAVDGSMKTLAQSKNNLKFGAVVYRDLSEGEEYLCEKINLTSDYKEVVGWLSTVYSSAKNLNDKDEPEAVFWGLKEALRNVNLPDNQTNFIVLVGDAGNHNRDDASQVPREILIDLIVKKNVNVLAYQVHHNGNENYQSFITQVSDILRTAAFNAWDSDKKLFGECNLNTPPILSNKAAGTYEMQGSPIQGRLVYSKPGGEIRPYALQDQLKTFIETTEGDVNKLIGFLNQILSGGKFDDVPQQYKPIVASMLIQSGISQSQLAFLQKARYQFFTTAYTALQPSNLSNPLFLPVVFMSRNEVSELRSDLSKVSLSITDDEARQKMYDAWISILSSHLGEQNLNKMLGEDLAILVGYVTGLPSQSEFLKHVKLKDILDPKRFPLNLLSKWSAEISQKESRLNSILQDNKYHYEFLSYDIHYYWLSQNDLP